jgi:hypothetical protein
MALDEATTRAVRDLWEVGARHGRPPAPTPEADPWEEDDDPFGPARAATVVEFMGTPSVVVRLYADGRDDVLVEDIVELETPRQDTAAVVEEVLAGRAHRRVRSGLLWNLVNTAMRNPAPSELVVTVLDPDAVRTYEAPILLTMGTGPWLTSLPLAEDARRTRWRPSGR